MNSPEKLAGRLSIWCLEKAALASLEGCNGSPREAPWAVSPEAWVHSPEGRDAISIPEKAERAYPFNVAEEVQDWFAAGIAQARCSTPPRREAPQPRSWIPNADSSETDLCPNGYTRHNLVAPASAPGNNSMHLSLRFRTELPQNGHEP